MNLFQELRQRRVFQIASANVVGSWGILQFFAFLESRMTVSPHMVNLIGLAHLALAKGNIAQSKEHLDMTLKAWTRASTEFLPAREAHELAGLLDAH